jgi:hypothetical protein
MRSTSLKCACGGDLSVHHTYRGSDAVRTSAARCEQCGHPATIVAFVAVQSPRVGEGASAVAGRIKRGEVVPGLVRPSIPLPGSSDAVAASE